MLLLATLADVKTWLKIPSDQVDSDPLIERIIGAASAYVESWLQRTLASTQYTEVRSGNGSPRMMLRAYPTISIQSLKIDQISIAQSSAGSSGWVLDSPQYSVLALVGHKFWRGVGNVEIQYTAGYATVPADIEQAVIEICGRKFNTMDRIGVTSKSLAGETISFSQADLNAEIKNMLRRYERGVLP